MSKRTETLILFRNCQEHFGLGFKKLEIENKCFQIVKWHMLKYSVDENLEKAEKQNEHLAWLLRD